MAGKDLSYCFDVHYHINYNNKYLYFAAHYGDGLHRTIITPDMFHRNYNIQEP